LQTIRKNRLMIRTSIGQGVPFLEFENQSVDFGMSGMWRITEA